MVNKTKMLAISIGSLIIAFISYLLWMEGFIDIKIMGIINWIAGSIGLMALLFLVNNSTMKQTSVIIQKGHYDEKIIKAETEIFPNFLVPTNTHRNCIFRIKLQMKEFKKHPLFYIIRKCEMNTCAQELNKDIKLDPGFTHVFDVFIKSNEKLNFKFNEDVTIKELLVEEVYIA